MKKTFIHCKECKKLVEKTAKNGYICEGCNASLVDDTVNASSFFIRNPFAAQTKMEISYSSHDDAIHRLKGKK